MNKKIVIIIALILILCFIIGAIFVINNNKKQSIEEKYKQILLDEETTKWWIFKIDLVKFIWNGDDVTIVVSAYFHNGEKYSDGGVVVNSKTNQIKSAYGENELQGLLKTVDFNQ